MSLPQNRNRNQKRNFDSLEGDTKHIRIRSERVGVIVPSGKEVEAFEFFANRVRKARIPHVVADTECSYAQKLPGLDGESLDTDCRDGEECCEEVLREQHRSRRAKSEWRGRQ